MKNLSIALLSLLFCMTINNSVAASIAVADYNDVIARSDLIAVGTLNKLPSNDVNEELYSISISQVLKGDPSVKAVLSVPVNIDSSEGIPPQIEPGQSYVLFLKNTGIELPFGINDGKPYRLVGNWKGIVALDASAQEKRSVQNVRQHYKIDIFSNAQAFCEAISYVVSPKGNSISPEAQKMIDALKLTVTSS